jgi:hypothetical protein
VVVRRNVVAHAAEEVGAVARLADVRPQAGQVAPVVGELVAQQGEVVLLERGRGEGRFGVEEAGQLGDDGFSLLGKKKKKVSFMS